MRAGNVDVATWFVRHRPKGDTSAAAATLEVDAPTSGEAIERVRATVPEGRIVTSVARY